MAMSWAEVTRHPDYKNLSREEKQQWRDDYYRDVVTPQLSEDDDPVKMKTEFFSHTRELDPTIEPLGPDQSMASSGKGAFKWMVNAAKHMVLPETIADPELRRQLTMKRELVTNRPVTSNDLLNNVPGPDVMAGRGLLSLMGYSDKQEKAPDPLEARIEPPLSPELKRAIVTDAALVPATYAGGALLHGAGTLTGKVLPRTGSVLSAIGKALLPETVPQGVASVLTSGTSDIARGLFQGGKAVKQIIKDRVAEKQAAQEVEELLARAKAQREAAREAEQVLEPPAPVKKEAPLPKVEEKISAPRVEEPIPTGDPDVIIQKHIPPVMNEGTPIPQGKTRTVRPQDAVKRDKMLTVRNDMVEQIERMIDNGDVTVDEFLNDPTVYLEERIMGKYKNNDFLRKSVIKKIENKYRPSEEYIKKVLREEERKHLEQLEQPIENTLDNVEIIPPAQRFATPYEGPRVTAPRSEAPRPPKETGKPDFFDQQLKAHPDLAPAIARDRTLRDNLVKHLSKKIDAGELDLNKILKDPEALTPEIVGPKFTTNPVMRKALLDKLADHYGTGFVEIPKGMETYKPFENLDPTLSQGKLFEQPAAREVAAAAPEPKVETPKTEPSFLPSGKVKDQRVDLDAIAVDGMYQRAEGRKAYSERINPGKLRYWFTKYVVDRSGNAKKELLKLGKVGEDAVRKYELSKGASAEAGRQIEAAFDTVYKGLSQDEERYLNRYLSSKRVIEIGENDPAHVFSEGLRPEQHQAWINSLPAAIREKIEAHAQKYWTVMRDQLTDLYKHGLLNDEQFKAIAAKGIHYSPQQYLGWLDPETTYRVGNESMSVSSSGIKHLEQGSVDHLELDSRQLMAEVVTRTQSRIYRNEANKTLAAIAKENPENGIIAIGPGDAANPPQGWAVLSYMKDGEPVDFLVKNSVAKEWLEMDAVVQEDVAKMIRFWSGGNLVRALATGMNPAFAINNLPRDIAHVWLTTKEYSNVLPKFLGQLAGDYRATWRDAWKKTGAYNDFIREGGGMAFLTNQGQTGKLNGAMKTIGAALGKLGEFTEIWTRLALRNRAMINGRTAEEATWIARSYMDFAQGGTGAKFVDTAVPYFNASIQGTRGILRSAKKDPARFVFKVAQLSALALGLKRAGEAVNSEAWESIPAREKASKFILPIFIPYTDSRGERRWYYFGIQKDQSQRFFASVVDLFDDLRAGKRVDTKQVAQSFNEFIPIVPTNLLPPIIDAVLAYRNYDTFREEQVWKGKKVEPHAEYYLDTPAPYKALGKALNMSPIRSQRAVQSLVPSNPVTEVAGMAASSDILAKDFKATEGWAGKLLFTMARTPGIDKVMRSTPPVSRVYADINDTIERKYNTGDYERRLEFDEILRESPDDKARIRKFILDQKDPAVKSKLIDRWRKAVKMKDLPDRFWYLDITSDPPEMGAEKFYQRYRTLNEKDRRQLLRNLWRAGGNMNPRFMKTLRDLSKGEIQEGAYE